MISYSSMYVSTIDLYQWLLQRLYHPHPSPCPHLGSLHVLSHPFASFKCSRLWPCSGVLSFYYASSFYFFPNGHRQISLKCIRGLLMDFECLFMCFNSLKIHKLCSWKQGCTQLDETFRMDGIGMRLATGTQFQTGVLLPSLHHVLESTELWRSHAISQ